MESSVAGAAQYNDGGAADKAETGPLRHEPANGFAVAAGGG